MAKKVQKVTKDTPKVIKRREALPLSELLGAYKEVQAEGGHIGDLAKRLDRPETSVNQRLVVARKQVAALGKELPPLKRKPRVGGGRTASTISAEEFEELFG